MKRNRKGAGRRRRSLRIWTRAEAQAALPYISSVVRSLREHWLSPQVHRHALCRLANRPGRPDRDSLIAQEGKRVRSERPKHVSSKRWKRSRHST